MKYLIRPMRKEDISDVISGEKKVFEDSLGEDFLIHDFELNPFSYYLVLEINGKIKGYMGTWIHDNLEILNFYVDKRYQGMGFGSMMLEFIIEVSKKSNVKSITLEVRKNNIIAISLYRKYGFKEVGIRNRYYNNGDDAILMEKKLVEL